MNTTRFQIGRDGPDDWVVFVFQGEVLRETFLAESEVEARAKVRHLQGRNRFSVGSVMSFVGSLGMYGWM
jgi:hypothetical protein